MKEKTSKTKKAKDDKIDTTKYTSKVSVHGEIASQPIVKLLDEFFANMNSGEQIDNEHLVTFLEDQNIRLTNSIKTDIPLYASKQTEAVKSGLIKRVKVNENNKYSKWVYTKV